MSQPPSRAGSIHSGHSSGGSIGSIGSALSRASRKGRRRFFATNPARSSSSTNIRASSLVRDGLGETPALPSQEPKKARRRRAHHAVERRIRDNINERLNELSTLVPRHRLDDEKIKKYINGAASISSIGDETNPPRKTEILSSSVTWMRDLMSMLYLKLQHEHQVKEYIDCLGGTWPFSSSLAESYMKTELLDAAEKNSVCDILYSRAPGSGLYVPKHTKIDGEPITPLSAGTSVEISEGYSSNIPSSFPSSNEDPLSLELHPSPCNERIRNSVIPDFRCTFCEKPFKNSYEWKRHQEAIHVPSKLWICDPMDPDFALALYGNAMDSLPKDGIGSAYRQCAANPECDRTFYRRDHLAQHFRQTHHVSSKDRINGYIARCQKDAPPLPLEDPALHCGFCGERFETWSSRVVHITEHFKSGEQWINWWPERKSAKREIESYSKASTSFHTTE
jgi:Helix-loop-helix DNA-binding domain/Zinc finger, C2H2 type